MRGSYKIALYVILSMLHARFIAIRIRSGKNLFFRLSKVHFIDLKRKTGSRFHDAVICIRNQSYSVTMSQKQMPHSPDKWVRLCKNHPGVKYRTLLATWLVLTHSCYPPFLVPSSVLPFPPLFSP